MYERSLIPQIGNQPSLLLKICLKCQYFYWNIGYETKKRPFGSLSWFYWKQPFIHTFFLKLHLKTSHLVCLPPPKISDNGFIITQTRQWGFVSYLKVQRVLKDFTLKSLVSVKFFMNCWWFKFIVQAVHRRCILVCQCLVYKETHSTAISPHLSLWQDPCNGDSTGWRWKVLVACFMEAKKKNLFFLSLPHLLHISDTEKGKRKPSTS